MPLLRRLSVAPRLVGAFALLALELEPCHGTYTGFLLRHGATTGVFAATARGGLSGTNR